MQRLLVVGLLLVVAAASVTVTSAGSPGSAKRPSGSCRDWVVAAAFRPQITRVRPLVARMKRAFGAPGLSVAIAADGKIVWSQSCGFADLKRRTAVTRTTLFRVGSVSKPITAAAAARLYQAGRLDVDAEAQRYVRFPRKGAPITLRQLGGHLAGIRHYEGEETVSTKHYRSVTDSLAVFENDPLIAKPGTRYSYSSYGFNLLGAAIEGAARKPFAAAVADALLRPLAMTRTRLDDGRGANRASFYEVTRARRAVPAPRVDLSNRYPSGGFLSTAEDLARFGTGISDPRFLGVRAQALLFTSQRTRTGEPTRYGFGFEVRPSPFGGFAGHTGNVVGGTAFLLIHPKKHVVVALTTNVGFVTAPTPPALARNVPTPPQLVTPFIRAIAAKG